VLKKCFLPQRAQRFFTKFAKSKKNITLKESILQQKQHKNYVAHFLYDKNYIFAVPFD